MYNQKSLNNLKKFKKGESGFSKQKRELKFIEKFCREFSVSYKNLPSHNDLSKVLLTLINSPIDKLEKISANELAPAYIRFLIRDLMDENKSFHVLQQIFDRVYGRPKQQIEIEKKENHSLLIFEVDAEGNRLLAEQNENTIEIDARESEHAQPNENENSI